MCGMVYFCVIVVIILVVGCLLVRLVILICVCMVCWLYIVVGRLFVFRSIVVWLVWLVCFGVG